MRISARRRPNGLWRGKIVDFGFALEETPVEWRIELWSNRCYGQSAILHASGKLAAFAAL